MQKDLFERALRFREENSREVQDHATFREVLKAEGGFIWGSWCGGRACEEKIKEETKATIRVIPFGAEGKSDKPCVECGSPGKHRVVWAKAY
jgi:prolyl-tRNA synthetase